MNVDPCESAAGDPRLEQLAPMKKNPTTVVIDRAGVLRYHGQFAHGKDTFAEEALMAVLQGKEVRTKETREHG